MIGRLCSLVTWPAAKSTIVLSSSMVTRLHRYATSSGASSMPMAAASMGATGVVLGGVVAEDREVPDIAPGWKAIGDDIGQTDFAAPRAQRAGACGQPRAGCGRRARRAARRHNHRAPGRCTSSGPWYAAANERPPTDTVPPVRLPRVACSIGVVLAVGALGSSAGRAATTAPMLKLTKVAALTGTTAMSVRAGDAALYLTEQAGKVRAIRRGKLVTAPVVDLTDVVSQDGGERGLLGLAFSTDGSNLYVDYTARRRQHARRRARHGSPRRRSEVAPHRAHRRPAPAQSQRGPAGGRARRHALHRPR